MADITQCEGLTDTGDECPKKDQCYRNTALPTSGWQSWFVASPWFNGQCEMFWSNEDYVHNRGVHNRGSGNNNQESDQQQGTSDVAGQSHCENGDKPQIP